MPTSGEARPDPKARTLARGPRRYRRKVASPKQWQAIIAEKGAPCRLCYVLGTNGHVPAALLTALTDAEYAYAVERGGEGYFERAYGVRCER